MLSHLDKILPPSFWALILLIFGWLIAKIFPLLTEKFLNKIKLNYLFKRTGWEDNFLRISKNLTPNRFFGQVVKYFILILTLYGSFEILNWQKGAYFLEKIIYYYPNIFIACFIFIVAVLLVDFSKKIMVGTLEKEKITYSNSLGKILSGIIWTFSILAILYQLKVVPSLILAIFIGVVFAVSLALGLAFGLGGKELIKEILKEFKEKFK